MRAHGNFDFRCVALPIGGNRGMENACVVLRYVALRCGFFYVVFNKFRKSFATQVRE